MLEHVGLACWARTTSFRLDSTDNLDTLYISETTFFVHPPRFRIARCRSLLESFHIDHVRTDRHGFCNLSDGRQTGHRGIHRSIRCKHDP